MMILLLKRLSEFLFEIKDLEACIWIIIIYYLKCSENNWAAGSIRSSLKLTFWTLQSCLTSSGSLLSVRRLVCTAWCQIFWQCRSSRTYFGPILVRTGNGPAHEPETKRRARAWVWHEFNLLRASSRIAKLGYCRVKILNSFMITSNWQAHNLSRTIIRQARESFESLLSCLNLCNSPRQGSKKSFKRVKMAKGTSFAWEKSARGSVIHR